MIYPDTGCLVKFYYPESDSPKVIAAAGDGPFMYTAFHELEIMSALQGKRGRGEASAEQVQATIEAIETDVRTGRLERRLPEWPAVFASAIHLARLHGATTNCRALDILHCTLAVHLQAAALLTTDLRQKAFASVLELSVLP